MARQTRKQDAANEDQIDQHFDDETRPEAEQQPQVPTERTYSKTAQIDHDLYKMKVTNMLKNMSWTEEPDLHKVKHEHWFHTVDSNGTKQKYSSMVGGHFHEMTVTPQKSGPPIVKCGPAVKEIKVLQKGKWVKKLVPYMDEDNHTHDVEYIKSDKITARQINAQASLVVGAAEARTQPIPGIMG